jgi:hypothetical protein
MWSPWPLQTGVLYLKLIAGGESPLIFFINFLSLYRSAKAASSLVSCMRVRQEPTQVDQLSGATILGKNLLKWTTFQVKPFMVGSWPYLQSMHRVGKFCQGEMLLLKSKSNLQRKFLNTALVLVWVIVFMVIL